MRRFVSSSNVSPGAAQTLRLQTDWRPGRRGVCCRRGSGRCFAAGWDIYCPWKLWAGDIWHHHWHNWGWLTDPGPALWIVTTPSIVCVGSAVPGRRTSWGNRMHFFHWRFFSHSRKLATKAVSRLKLIACRLQTRQWYCQRGDHAGVTGPGRSCHHSNMWWQSKVTQYTTWHLVTNCQLPFANTGSGGSKPVHHPGSWVRQIKLNVACDLSPYFNNKLWNWGIYSPFSYTEALYNA